VSAAGEAGIDTQTARYSRNVNGLLVGQCTTESSPLGHRLHVPFVRLERGEQLVVVVERHAHVDEDIRLAGAHLRDLVEEERALERRLLEHQHLVGAVAHVAHGRRRAHILGRRRGADDDDDDQAAVLIRQILRNLQAVDVRALVAETNDARVPTSGAGSEKERTSALTL